MADSTPQGLEDVLKINIDKPTGKSRAEQLSNISNRDVFTTEPPQRDALITYGSGDYTNVLLHKGITAALIGPGGSGKSMMLLQIAIAVAGNMPWLQYFTVASTGNVIIIMGEESEEEIFRRLYRINQGNHIDDSMIKSIEQHLYPMSMSGLDARLCEDDGDLTAFAEAIVKKANEIGDVVLIIFDPASRFMSDEAEKDNAKGTRFIESLEYLRDNIESEPTIIIGHHTNKTGTSGRTNQTAARGSSAITDGVRAQINLETIGKAPDNAWDPMPYPHLVGMRHVKANYTPKMPFKVLSRRCGGVLEVDEDALRGLQDGDTPASSTNNSSNSSSRSIDDA
jgi:regulatory protein RepA